VIGACGWFSSPPVEVSDGESDGQDLPGEWDGDTPPDGWELPDGQDAEWDGSDLPRFHISGTIYEDLGGEGDLSDALAVAGTNVLLYRDGGDGIPDGVDDIFVSQAVTGSAGRYDLEAPSGSTYWVAVDARTLRASGGFNTGYGPRSVWPEQTYGPAGSLCARWSGESTSLAEAGRCFGGRRGSASDNAADLAAAEHVAMVTLSAADVVDVSFGFSFNVVTHTDDGMLEDGSGLAMQGSLRQFIINANAIREANVMRFVPAVAPGMGGTDGSWWRITVGEALPSIDDSATTVDGTAYDLSDGTSRRDSLPGSLGEGGNVGLDGLSLSRVDRPELELRGGGTVANGLVIRGDNATVRFLSLTAFTLARDDGHVFIDSADGTTIRSCIICTGPEGFQTPSDGPAPGSGITASGAARVTVSGNLIGYCGGKGINPREGSASWEIQANEIRSNSLLYEYGDGIDIANSGSGFTVRGNLVTENRGGGIDMWQSGGAHTIENNTITQNGLEGTETFGIRLYGQGTAVRRNVIRENAGPGVLVTMLDPDEEGTPGLYNRITGNRFGGNGGNAIDLVGSESNSTGDGITLNDGGFGDQCGYSDSSGNRGLDYPQIEDTGLNGSGTLLTVSGTACPGSDVEFYRAEAGAGDSAGSGGDFGEGVDYLGSLGTGPTGAFSGTLSVILNESHYISAIAVDAQGNTSEFSENVRAGGGNG